MNILAQINELASSPGCVYEALESILQSCEAPEDVTERTWLTVKLSICEFLAAHIEFPDFCRDRSRLAQCTQLLETKATWWTTYSGNYRQISVICSEYQPHSGARRALGVIKNATDLFSRYEEDQRKVLAFAENAFSVIVERWGALSRNLTTGFSVFESQIDTLQQNARFESSQIFDRIFALDVTLASTIKELQITANMGRILNNQSSQLLAQFQQFESSMSKLEIQQMNTVDDLRSSVQQTSTVLEATNQALKGYSKVLLVFTDILRLLFSVVSRFWLAFFFVIFLTVWFSSQKRNVFKPIGTATKEYIDPIFL